MEFSAQWGGTNEHSIGDAIDHDLFLENFVTMDYCLSKYTILINNFFTYSQ